MRFKSLHYTGKTCYLDRYGNTLLRERDLDGVTYFIDRSQAIGLREGNHPVVECTDFYRLVNVNKNGTATVIGIKDPKKIRALSGLDPDKQDRFWEEMYWGPYTFWYTF